LLEQTIGLIEFAPVRTEPCQESEASGQLVCLPNFLAGLDTFRRSILRSFEISDIAVKLGQAEHRHRNYPVEFIPSRQRACLFVILNSARAVASLPSRFPELRQYRGGESMSISETSPVK
jgi:hypothetical protein